MEMHIKTKLDYVNYYTQETQKSAEKKQVHQMFLPSGLGPVFLARTLGWHDRWRGCRHAEVCSRLGPSNWVTEGKYYNVDQTFSRLNIAERKDTYLLLISDDNITGDLDVFFKWTQTNFTYIGTGG